MVWAPATAAVGVVADATCDDRQPPTTVNTKAETVTRKVVTRKVVTRKVVTRKAVTRKAVTRKAVTRKAVTPKAVRPRIGTRRAEGQADRSDIAGELGRSVRRRPVVDWRKLPKSGPPMTSGYQPNDGNTNAT
jgi:hypothetical protein